MKKVLVTIFVLMACFHYTYGQKAIYADANKNDVQRMNFEIIGKAANNLLIYKEVKGRHWITIYDENMRELENVPITVLPIKEDLLDVAFYPYDNFTYLLFQYQRDNIVYCEAARIEPNGKILEEPTLLDTTMISYRAENKIYNHFTSDDRSKIMLIKINRKEKGYYRFSTRLYNAGLELLQANQFSVPMQNKGDYLTGYSVDNQGNLVFVKYNRMTSGNIGEASLMVKPVGRQDFKAQPLNLGNLFLDDIKVRIDDNHQRYMLTSFYAENKKGNMAGMYNYAFDKATNAVAYEKTAALSEDLKKRAKARFTGSKAALNDYFINNIVLHDDGGYTVGAEALYTSDNGGMWDRWGYGGYPYFYGPYGWYGSYWGGWGSWGGWGRYWSPYYYYSPFFYRSYWWGNGWYGNGGERYHADNVVLLSFDKNGNKEWDNVIIKKQNETITDGTISYQVMLKGNNMHFFMNNSGKISNLEDVEVNRDGVMRQNEALAAQDKKAEFMPRYAKQVSPSEVIMPVLNKKTISFAKLHF